MDMETVVLVHGVGLHGAEMWFLRYRLQKYGYLSRQFSYSAWRKSLSENAASLQKFLDAQTADVIHLVGHSIGGLVIWKLFQDYPQQRPGRIVTLGTPCQGSVVAGRFSRVFLGRFCLGRSVMTGLFQELFPPPNREIGIIAGSLDIGTGLLLRLPRPNDSLIAVEETRHPAITNCLVLPVSHTGLLLAASVARQVCTFLKTGHFLK